MAENIDSIPGQQVLPGLIEVMEIESRVLDNPRNEAFCWEYVTNGGSPADAYLLKVNGDVSKLAAQKNASKLLKKDDVKERIRQIASIIQRKYEAQVLAYRMKGLTLDRKGMLDKDGKLKNLQELTDEQMAIVDIEMKWVDGGLRTVPSIGSRDKAADALQKMFGMNKDKMEVTGANGGNLILEVAFGRED